MAERSGSGVNPVISILGAIVLVIVCVGGYVWVTWMGPVHAGKVQSMAVYPIHRELSTGSALGGVNGGNNVYDEVIVLANVHIQSTTRLPLFLHDMWGVVTLADGTTQQDLAASHDDFTKVFVAYPALAPQQKAPVERGITMTPGQQLDGQMIFHFPITKQQWDQRKSFVVTVDFLHQDPLVMKTAGVPTVTVQ